MNPLHQSAVKSLLDYYITIVCVCVIGLPIKFIHQLAVISRLIITIVCVGLPMKSIHRLQLAHNAAARVVTKIFEQKFEHIITPLLETYIGFPS